MRETIMATLGTFTLVEGAFVGRLTTLTINADVRLEAVAERTSTAVPDYRLYRGTSELGAAWAKLSKSGRRFFLVTLDDPSFAKPIEARLVRSGESFTLMWSR
jgi:uncharacterized protein (DUF736 family)